MEKEAEATKDVAAQLQLLPGFRFHPTDEELVVHYLSRKTDARPFSIPIIAELDLYKFDPWDLPSQALFGEREWYFFSPRDRKYPNGARPNRAAASGYWKATGTDKPILSSSAGGPQKVGVKKALVFYAGKAAKGAKTNWIMHEYRLIDSGGKPFPARKKGSLRLDDWVLCRIYNRDVGSQKPHELPEQKSAAYEDSGLEDVMTSLQDIEDSKIDFLPRQGLPQTSSQTNYSVLEKFLCGDTSENVSKSNLSDKDLEIFQGRAMRNCGADDLSILMQEDNRFLSADFDLPIDMKFSEPCQSELLKESGGQIDRSLRRPRASSLPEILHNLRLVRQKVSFDSDDEELQSTYQSPMFSARKQSRELQESNCNFNPFFASSAENLLRPDFVRAKIESEDNFFVHMNDLFPEQMSSFS
ncbi:hypothetical protein O6H91_18G047900 [Diphasiastrum complanatum]|uniref:Uncharacterized protein n=2 Tax=Diphasiastrum complanatum TaxID=34168 RepID=A0ACC2B0Q9_DIPCM|nr:hypothetical protein O6H91_Y355200 [Diphasiastrum complanatum]KAJ7523349.1 hypothetical protein O6H91_18G047900 [Diphasiastrum complanatum]KAJ7523350.1 hypothetical protein O6H91_18G047900 [Diphasiastrum complanatum]